MSEHVEAHHHPNYVKVWVILCVLLAISVAGPEVGARFDMQWLTLLTAFGIAIVKAYLVCKNFMHLNVEKRYVVYVLLFFAAVAPDVMKFEGTNWTKFDYHTPEPAGHHDSSAEGAAHH